MRSGTLVALVAAAALAGCGGSPDGSGSAYRPAAKASSFPEPAGRTLAGVLREAEEGELVVSPAGMAFRPGTNRIGFGVFTRAREQVSDAEVALYVARGEKGRARGPFPARIEDLETEARYRSKTTADDPDAAQVIYASEVELPIKGDYRVGALVRRGGQLASAGLFNATAADHEAIPAPGERAPRVHTPTADDVADVSEIDTRDPPSTMHEEDLADVLGRKPVVLIFATPALCQSRVCGPVVDVGEQVKSEHGDRVAFIFMEIFEDNQFDKGPREQVTRFGLQSEPWLFVMDRKGVVRTAIEGAFSVRELERAVRRAS